MNQSWRRCTDNICSLMVRDQQNQYDMCSKTDLLLVYCSNILLISLFLVTQNAISTVCYDFLSFLSVDQEYIFIVSLVFDSECRLLWITLTTSVCMSAERTNNSLSTCYICKTLSSDFFAIM